jgi:hypothetical protein
VLLSDSENPIRKIKSVKINNMNKRENGKNILQGHCVLPKKEKGTADS